MRMALHPDDPPIPGAARRRRPDRVHAGPIPANLRRRAGVTATGMLFCQGCVTEMGVDVYETSPRNGTSQQDRIRAFQKRARARCRASRRCFWMKAT